MKNIFSINLQTNEQECDRIVYKDPSDTIREEIEKVNKEFVAISKKAKKPSLYARIQMISFYGSFMAFLFFLDFWVEKGFVRAVKENFILFILFIGLFLLSITFLVIRTVVGKKIQESEEVKSLNSKSDELLNKIMEDLGVPSSRIDVDIYVTPYIMKNDQRVSASAKIDYINSIFAFYTDSEYIYLANIEHVYRIRKDSIKAIQKSDYSVNIDRWVKDVPFKSEEYRKYNIIGKRTYYTIPKIYRISFVLNESEYYFIIPEYDFDKISEQLK